MREAFLHRFELDGVRYVIDPETSFCFECDEVSWDVIAHYPHTPLTRIVHLLKDGHPENEIKEVVGELEWLRQTKAILPGRSLDEIKKQFEVDGGCRELNLKLRSIEQVGEVWTRNAFALLLGRAEKHQRLSFTLETPDNKTYPKLFGLLENAASLAKLSGKELDIFLCLPLLNSLRPLRLFACISSADTLSEALGLIEKCDLGSAGKVAKLLESPCFSTESFVEVPLTGADALPIIKTLEKAGVKHFNLNMKSAFLSSPDTAPDKIFASLQEVMRYYEQQLSQKKALRIEPIARLFWRIYNGTGQRRSDPAGTNALAVDSDGAIYPSTEYRSLKRHCLGNVKEGHFDNSALKRFDDLGVTTTPVCMSCWARQLCGGGCAAVNERLSGVWNTPREDWCNAQREHIARCVAAFNTLNQSGVNFNRVYGDMRPAKRKGGFLKLAWAALNMNISLRALEEADAPLLKKWEDWNDAAYFTLHERSVLTTTKYDREMDALHPRGLAQEFVLTRKDGAAMGLLRVQVSSLPETLQLSLYFAKAEDYESGSIRKSLKFILEESAKSQAVKHVLINIGEGESQLLAMLKALDFEAVGVQRDALYLHKRYHNTISLHRKIA